MIKNPNKVDTSKLRKEIRVGMWAVEFVYSRHGWDLQLYHTFDGEHMEGSLHFKNRAVDLSLPPVAYAGLAGEIKLVLGDEYDVIVEAECLHIEWDPK